MGALKLILPDSKIIRPKLNWKPDIPDQRDFLFSDYFKVRPRLPASVNLRAKMSAIEDQGQLGSCTANALAQCYEFLCRQANDPFELSRLFLYRSEREYINEIYEDSGAYLRDGIKSLKTRGVCSETTWPYVISKFKQKPPARAYTEAEKHKIEKYLRIVKIQEMKQCLANGIPFSFGVPVYESFMSSTVAKTGRIPMPRSSEAMLGGHAMAMCGYDEKYFYGANSWSSSWGDKGFFRMPISYMEQAEDNWGILLLATTKLMTPQLLVA